MQLKTERETAPLKRREKGAHRVGHLCPVKSFRTFSLERGIVSDIPQKISEGENKQIIKRKFHLGNGNAIPEEMTEKKLPDDFRLPKEAKKNSLF